MPIGSIVTSLIKDPSFCLIFKYFLLYIKVCNVLIYLIGGCFGSWLITLELLQNPYEKMLPEPRLLKKWMGIVALYSPIRYNHNALLCCVRHSPSSVGT